MTNSQISGLETSIPNGTIGNQTRNTKHGSMRKDSTFTDTNGVVKNMSMMHSYEHQESKELNVETSNSSIKGSNLKKISIDITKK